MKKLFAGKCSMLVILTAAFMSAGAQFAPVAVTVQSLDAGYTAVEGLPVVLESVPAVAESESLWVKDLNDVYKSRRLFAVST